MSSLTSFLRVSFSTISEASQVKPSLLDKVEVEILQEGLAGATMVGIDNDSLIISQVKPILQFQHASFYFAHQVKRNKLFQASCELCQASHGLPQASREMH